MIRNMRCDNISDQNFFILGIPLSEVHHFHKIITPKEV
ncbi:hypothetical protein EC3431_1748 [Escherichia coli 3431]|nr:hypothetical protein EC3431_1748 [Escherichia coli 3431]